jgi:hypothetical protein
MKLKNIYLFVVMALALGACDDDIEIWDSATLDYSGTYVCQVLKADGSVYADYSDSRKIDIYNTDANATNEIWFTDHDKWLEITSKFFLNGDASDFASKSLAYDDLTLNTSMVKVPETAPTAAGETTMKNIWGAKTALVEGKILPKAMTTIGGNVADSIYMKVVFMYGDVTFKSQEVPEAYRANPDVAEFEWIFESSVYDATSTDETYVYSGHRYTGFSEDSH